MLSTQHNLLTMAWMYQSLICPPALHHLHNIKCYLSQAHKLDTVTDQTWKQPLHYKCILWIVEITNNMNFIHLLCS